MVMFICFPLYAKNGFFSSEQPRRPAAYSWELGMVEYKLDGAQVFGLGDLKCIDFCIKIRRIFLFLFI